MGRCSLVLASLVIVLSIGSSGGPHSSPPCPTSINNDFPLELSASIAASSQKRELVSIHPKVSQQHQLRQTKSRDIDVVYSGMALKGYIAEAEKAKEATPSSGPVYRSLFANDGFPPTIEGLGNREFIYGKLSSRWFGMEGFTPNMIISGEKGKEDASEGRSISLKLAGDNVVVSVPPGASVNVFVSKDDSKTSAKALMQAADAIEVEYEGVSEADMFLSKDINSINEDVCAREDKASALLLGFAKFAKMTKELADHVIMLKNSDKTWISDMIVKARLLLGNLARRVVRASKISINLTGPKVSIDIQLSAFFKD